jgi:hypothetical protein
MCVPAPPHLSQRPEPPQKEQILVFESSPDDAMILLAVLGTGVYFMRRRASL